MKLYHGGPAGLTEILPPSVSGVKSAVQIAAEAGSTLDSAHVRGDRVFLTSDQRSAALFASASAEPTVYLVEPVGILEPDPDCNEPGLSWQCPAARVLTWRRMTDNEVDGYRKVLLGELV